MNQGISLSGRGCEESVNWMSREIPRRAIMWGIAKRKPDAVERAAAAVKTAIGIGLIAASGFFTGGWR
jgi:hypothetical protein